MKWKTAPTFIVHRSSFIVPRSYFIVQKKTPDGRLARRGSEPANPFAPSIACRARSRSGSSQLVDRFDHLRRDQLLQKRRQTVLLILSDHAAGDRLDLGAGVAHR